MTIINPKSITGVTSITTPSGSDNLFTVHTNNTTERVRINNDGDVIVGSGITVSPDGDIFATGVTTATTFSGSGASLTNLNASNIASGTVPTARLGSGTASSSTFLRGDSTFATVTSVGGATGVDFNDDVKIRLGTGNDLEIYHGSDQNYVSVTGTGNLNLTCAGSVVTKVNSSEDAIVCNANGSVDLYNNNVKRLATRSGGNSADGVIIHGNASNSSVNLYTESTIRGTLYANSSNLIGFLDNSGQWAFSVAAVGGNTISYNNFVPSSDNGLDLGSSSKRWQNVYTTDLQLSNEGSTNDIDGTWGNYTIQEGESDLFLINNRSGKKYKFNLTEVS